MWLVNRHATYRTGVGGVKAWMGWRRIRAAFMSYSKYLCCLPFWFLMWKYEHKFNKCCDAANTKGPTLQAHRVDDATAKIHEIWHEHSSVRPSSPPPPLSLTSPDLTSTLWLAHSPNLSLHLLKDPRCVFGIEVIAVMSPRQSWRD